MAFILRATYKKVDIPSELDSTLSISRGDLDGRSSSDSRHLSENKCSSY